MNNFNIFIYREFNSDLKYYTPENLIQHFKDFGINENRIFSFETLLKKHKRLQYFDLEYYKQNNLDLKFTNDLDYVLDFLKIKNLGKKKISQKMDDLKMEIFNNRDFNINMETIIEFLKSKPEKLQNLFPIINFFTRKQREEISFISKTRLIYFDEEVTNCQIEEESILQDILPHQNEELKKLNILNIGAGGRTINNTLINVDFQRDLKELDLNGHTSNCVLCDMDNLIFKDSVIDAIISLHIWEHSMDPVKTLKEWVRVLKPGGKIGIVNPDFRYNWSASTDHYIYGHKWNTEANITRKMIDLYFPELKIIKIGTFKNKLSYNIVLQKEGEYKLNSNIKPKSGYEIDKGVHSNQAYFYHNNKINL